MADDLLQIWKLPKVPKNEIYQTSIFSFRKDYSIKTTEGSILLNNATGPIQLFDANSIEDNFDYEYLHIGLVQVGVKALTREVRDTSILLCLRDKRMLDFNASLLSVVQSKLDEGPVHFNYFPNIMVGLQDPNILRVLTLYVKFENLEMANSSYPFLLTFRIRYKYMVNPNNPAAKRSSPINRTNFYQTIIRNSNKTISRTIRWADVQFPEEWKLRNEVADAETQGYESPRRIELFNM